MNEDLKATLSRLETLLERLRVEYYRDVIERIFFLESEILNLRREMRRISDVLETLLRRLPRQVEESRLEVVEVPSIKKEGIPSKRQKTARSRERKVELTKENILRYLESEANDTELKILRLLLENPSYGSKGSTEIAKAIGKVREHTARTLKKLCEKGLLIREETSIPYSYSIPKEVSEALRLFFESRR